MKRFSSFLLLIVIISACKDNPSAPVKTLSTSLINSGLTNTLNGVDFFNDSSGVIVGWNGVVLRTQDSGKTWTSTKIDTNLYFYCASVHVNNLLIGGGGVIYSSSDHGLTFTRTFNTPYKVISDFGYFGSSQVIAIGGIFVYSGTTSTSSLIFSSVNGGSTWQNKAEEVGGVLTAIVCHGDSDCMIASNFFNAADTNRENKVFMSDDQCKTFHSIYNAGIRGINSLKSNDYVNFIGVGGGLIIRSSDGGNTWISDSTTTNESLYSVCIYSPTEYFACGSGGLLLHSTDAGATWSKINANTSVNLRCIIFPCPAYGIVVGDNGRIIRIVK